jgi:hypothetical protein
MDIAIVKVAWEKADQEKEQAVTGKKAVLLATESDRAFGIAESKHASVDGDSSGSSLLQFCLQILVNFE